MKSPRDVMITHLEWLKRERLRVIGEIDTLQHGLREIDATIKNWTNLLNERNPESGG